MKKRVLSLLLVLLMVVSLVPMSALADKSGNEIKQQISSTYATARSQNGGSFNGWCGAYVNYQLKILGINSYLESGGNGRDQFDYGTSAGSARPARPWSLRLQAAATKVLP